MHERSHNVVADAEKQWTLVVEASEAHGSPTMRGHGVVAKLVHAVAKLAENFSNLKRFHFNHLNSPLYSIVILVLIIKALLFMNIDDCYSKHRRQFHNA